MQLQGRQRAGFATAPELHLARHTRRRRLDSDASCGRISVLMLQQRGPL